MVTSDRPPRNAFEQYARKVYNPMGFSRGYNFVLWFIFGGAFTGFILARLQYLSFDVFCHGSGSSSTGADVGECYFYKMPYYRTGIMLHLATVLPAGLLGVLQFVPAIRHKCILYHKIAGHVALLLIFVGLIGALMIARVSFGGGVDIQSWIGLLAIISVVSLGLAYYNIKRKQIDQHRAWMLRAWFYMGSILTTRLISAIAVAVVSAYGTGFYAVWSCDKLLGTLDSAAEVYAKYPMCAPDRINGTVDGQVVVKASSATGALENGSAAWDITFGTGLWMAFVLHAIGVEIYLRLTPKEAERLRKVSYQRQLEMGMKNPGSAGLVLEKVCDAEPWMPPSENGPVEVHEEEEHTEHVAVAQK